MKKVNFKKVLIAFVAVFALMFIGVEKAEAQAATVGSGGGLFDPAAGTFIGANEAQDVLVSTVTVLKNTVNNVLGGQTSPSAQSYVTKARYFSAIYDALLGGKSVSTAIGTGLQAIAFRTSAGTNLTRNDLMNLRLEAIALLQ